MGPIQTEINKLINTAAAAVGVGSKMAEGERQADIKAEQEAAKAAKQAQAEQEKIAAEKKEASAVATEANLRLLGASDVEAKAYRLAQERGLANPKRMVFDKEGRPIATYEEIAQLLSGNSVSNATNDQVRMRKAVQTRRQLLEGKTHEERIQNVVLAAGGGR